MKKLNQSIVILDPIKSNSHKVFEFKQHLLWQNKRAQWSRYFRLTLATKYYF